MNPDDLFRNHEENEENNTFSMVSKKELQTANGIKYRDFDPSEINSLKEAENAFYLMTVELALETNGLFEDDGDEPSDAFFNECARVIKAFFQEQFYYLKKKMGYNSFSSYDANKAIGLYFLIKARF